MITNLYMGSVVVSFVIPSHNSAGHIKHAIFSIEKFCGYAYEIIVVDDCSDDVEGLDQLISSCRSCILVKKKTRTNAADSRNIGYSIAKGEFVFFLDSDDRLLDGYVTRRVDAHRENKVGVMFGRFLVTLDGEKNIARNIPSYLGGGFREYLFKCGGDIRSSSISICKTYFTGVLFDERQNKHQDWGFGIRNSDLGERMFFDHDCGVLLDARSSGNRMSGSSNIDASQYFLTEYAVSGDFAFGFIRAQIFPLIHRRDRVAISFFRKKLKENFPLMSSRIKFGAALILIISMPPFYGVINLVRCIKKIYAK